MVTHNPLHGSGRAGFPHPALALGNNAKPAQGIVMVDASRREPTVNQPPHTVPGNATILASPRQRAMPEPAGLEPEHVQRGLVHGHPKVSEMSTHHRAQPLPHFRDGSVHASPELSFHLAQLRLQAFAHRLPQHGKPSIAPLLPADVRKAEKVESLRLPSSTLLPVLGRKRTELQKPCLVGMQFQRELPESLLQLGPEPLGIRFPLEPHHDVIGETHDDHVALRSLPAPGLDPEVEHVVQVDIGHQRRCTSTLRRPLFHSCPFPVLQHARRSTISG